jgi:tetratricopeptide (TPR) repeat protein
LISDADYDAYRQEIETRLRFVTERLIEKDPKQAHAYVILAESRFRGGQVEAAFDAIHRGFRECGPTPELVMDKALLLRRTDPKASLEFLDSVVNLAALNPAMCQVYADVALGAGRPDKALEACRLAHKQQPGLLWAHRREAEICRLLGRTTEAAAALQPIRAYLATDPTGCELYVKTLCDAGSFALAEEFLKEVAAENRPIEVLLKAARGFAEVGRHEDAARWARIVLERDQTYAPALLILADSLRVQAEIGVRGWDHDKVRESLRAYRAVLRQQDDNLTVVNNIAWLELKALDLPKQAFESALPLRAVQDRVGLPADFMETLGAVYIGVGRFEDARRMLNEAIRTAGPRPGFYIHLALAHHGLQQPEMAEKCLLKAAELPKSPREIAELTDTIRLIQTTRK